MFKRRNVFSFSIAVLSSFILFNFQNCAPATTVVHNEPESADSTVRLIDDYSKAELQFAARKVEVHDEAVETGVNGLCTNNHNGARLRWALWSDESSSRPLMLGESVCRSGQFEVGLQALDSVICGIPHRLVVEGDWGGIAQAELEKRCQPLASEEIEISEFMPAGTHCSVEYVPATGLDSACTQVCYRDDKVVSSQTVDPLRCSSLMQKLASP